MGVPRVLLVSGSDSGGGAGLQADIKACAALGAYSSNAITALTAQNTTGVHGILGVATEFVVQQMDVVLSDVRPDCCKTGMLATAEVIGAVSDRVRRAVEEGLLRYGCVVDPVMCAASGDALVEPSAVAAIRSRMLPLARVATPNRFEAGVLLDGEAPSTLAEVRRAADQIRTRHACASVVVKGATLAADDVLAGDHLWFGPPRDQGPGADVTVDVYVDDQGCLELACSKIDTRNTHGTGCAFASALAARLATGVDVRTAVIDAKAYIDAALRASASLAIGTGAHGPINHAYATADWRSGN